MRKILIPRMRDLIRLFLILGIVLSGASCERYRHTNPLDPEYEGDYWNSELAELELQSLEISEDLPDLHNRYFELIPTIYNSGSSAATSVTASIHEDNDAVTLVYYTTVPIPDVHPGKAESPSWPDYFTLRIPKDTQTPFDFQCIVAILAAGGSSWADTTSVTIP